MLFVRKMAHFQTQIILVSVLLFKLSCTIRVSELYPYGSVFGDKRLPEYMEDVSSPEVKLTTPVKFFRREYDTIYVNSPNNVKLLLIQKHLNFFFNCRSMKMVFSVFWQKFRVTSMLSFPWITQLSQLCIRMLIVEDLELFGTDQAKIQIYWIVPNQNFNLFFRMPEISDLKNCL
jgi:hypothetical protein